MKSEKIVIVGATGVVGSAIAVMLSEMNYRLILVSRNLKKLNYLNEKIKQKCNFYQEVYEFDIENDKNEKLIEYLKINVDTIKSLIFLSRNSKYLKDDKENLDLNSFRNEYNISLLYPVNLCLQLNKQFKDKLCSIIFTSSIYGISVPKDELYIEEGFTPISYSSSRAAIIQASRHLSKKFSNVTNVNVVVLGGIENNQSISFKQKYSKLCPSKKMLSKEDLLHPYLYFINAPSSNFSGSVLIVDGGWTL